MSGRMTCRYPLDWPDGWPKTGDLYRHSSNRFKTTFDLARRQLQAELDRLGAASVVLTSWLDIRADGQMRADQARRKIPDPGVSLFFTLRGRPMVMAQDAFDTVHGNARSIGLAIENLRGLERHGGGHMMEKAFDGFAALPPPAMPNGRPWRQVLDMPLMDLSAADALILAEARFKGLSKRAHPDAGGTADAQAELNDAIARARTELGVIG
jgi:hypothetical protein